MMKAIFDRIVFLLNGVALSLVGLALVDFLLHPLAGDFTFHSSLYRAVVMLVLTPLPLLVGFLIIRRVPGNIVGPLLILWSGTVAYSTLRLEIGSVPFELFSFYDVVIGWYALCFMLLHFPDGKIYPPWAAPWLYSQGGISVLLATLAFLSAPSRNNVPNPFFVPALEKYANLILALALSSIILILLVIPVSLVLRYRKGSLLERQQIKWLALFGVIMAASTILGSIAYPLITGGAVLNRENNLFTLLFSFLTVLSPPLAIGVAVLRYHLWDIDVIIRRTLVYSVLTVTLAIIYIGSVIGLQELFQVFTGQHQSPVATVISTLVIVALIGRLKRRIQDIIDRRFYRKKYDAEKVLAAFSTTLRNEVDLDRLTNSILEVVEETMKPAHVSLWLREVDLQSRERQLAENSSQILS